MKKFWVAPGQPVSCQCLGRGGLYLAVLCAGICVAGGCAGPETLSDAEKKARIEQMYAEYRQEFPHVESITAENLAALEAQTDVVIVDVREPEEQAVAMIPGAITKEAFEADLEVYRHRPVVVHCTIGYRSGVYARELAERGIHVTNLEGSILSWAHAGEPVVGPDGEETKRIHVYGPKWALLPEDYEPVW